MLYTFKETLVDPDNHLSNWNASDASPCSWTGVNCTDGSVSAIVFPKTWSMSGPFPSETFGKLSNLETLDLHNLTGVFPRDVVDCSKLLTLNLSWSYISGAVPDEISKLKQLQVLDLSYAEFNGTVSNSSIGALQELRSLRLHSNYFVGAIPESISSLRKLEQLTLSGNLWNGTIPAGIFKLPSLRMLWLGDDETTGEVPYSDLSGWENMESLRLRMINFPQGPFPRGVESMRNLTMLHLSYCNLTGPIPEYIRNLTKLQAINLEFNQLNGSIPDMFGDMASLRDLYLNSNQLSGSIPASLWKCTKLSVLFLFSNNMHGDIAGIGNFTGLTRMDISNNMFSGAIPQALGNLTRLTQLNLSWNNLTGEIPARIAEWEDIYELRMKSNQITGEIPYTLGTKAAFNWVDFGSNQLHGVIPPNLCRGNQLQYFSAKTNKLTSSIPETYLNCSSLVTLWLANNYLNGTLEQNPLANKPKLAYFSVANNNFSGSLPVFARSNSTLQLLDLSGNKFTGEIPAEVDVNDLPKLRVLMLSNNQLQGKIPLWIGNLKQLQVLDLSNNQLTDSIPTDFGNLDGFKVGATEDDSAFENIPYSLAFDLNLTLADLSTPTTRILRATTVMDLSSNALNGSIPDDITNLASIVYLILSDNELEGEIPLGFANLTRLEVLYLDRNKLTGAILPELPSTVGKFNVSYNNLSGEVPSDGQMGTFTSSSYLPGNDGLCGTILNRVCMSVGTPPSPQPNAGVEEPDDEMQTSDVMSMAGVGVGLAVGFFGVLIISFLWTPARLCLYGSSMMFEEKSVVINHVTHSFRAIR